MRAARRCRPRRTPQPWIGGGQTKGTILPGNVTLVGDLNAIEIGRVKFTSTIEHTGATTVTVPVFVTGSQYRITDGTVPLLTLGENATRSSSFGGALTLRGNTADAGTTALTIGNNAIAADAGITFNSPTGFSNLIQFKRGGANSWIVYDANSTSLFLRDSVNGVMAMTFAPGAGTAGRVDFGGGVKIAGNVGFYGTAATAKQTVTGSRGGNAALASLLTSLAATGLITDSSTA